MTTDFITRDELSDAIRAATKTRTCLVRADDFYSGPDATRESDFDYIDPYELLYELGINNPNQN